MSAEDLENYETEMELQLYREYKDISAQFNFVVETERQVEGHLGSHLARLPASDARSRAIVEAMRTDEVAHGAAALAAGGARLPAPVRTLMRTVSGIMTGTAYWV